MTDTDIIKDANRYRWLRDRSDNVIIDLVSSRTWENVAGYKAQLDNLIDNELASASAECLQMAEVMPEPLPAKSKGALSHEENKQHNKKILDKFYEENAHLYTTPQQREWVGQPEERLFTEAQALDIAQKLFDSAALNAVPIGWVRKKEWVGLTDEDMDESHNFDFIHGARWAEARLKERNT